MLLSIQMAAHPIAAAVTAIVTVGQCCRRKSLAGMQPLRLALPTDYNRRLVGLSQDQGPETKYSRGLEAVLGPYAAAKSGCSCPNRVQFWGPISTSTVPLKIRPGSRERQDKCEDRVLRLRTHQMWPQCGASNQCDKIAPTHVSLHQGSHGECNS